MLNYKDELRIREIVQEEIKAETNLLPTKEDFFNWMDKIYTELIGIRQEMTVNTNQIQKNSNELKNVKKDVIYLQKHALS